jgi:hypothetical protein
MTNIAKIYREIYRLTVDANLRDANLRDANLLGAFLSGANPPQAPELSEPMEVSAPSNGTTPTAVVSASLG